MEVLVRHKEWKEQKIRKGRVQRSQRLTECGPLNQLKPDNPGPNGRQDSPVFKEKRP